MLAYAAHRRRIAQRRPAPHAMLLIVVGHIALIAAVMSARMDLPIRIPNPTEVRLIPLPPEPPKAQPEPRTEPKASPSAVDRVPVIVPVPRPDPDRVDSSPVPAVSDVAFVGPAIVPQPRVEPAPPVRLGPRFATPPGAVRPPYPASKIAGGEEAVLKLRLAIDERGRVVAVEPVGRADAAFLAAARRHLLAHWRYRPASEDGRALVSSTVVTLRFELD